MNGLDRLKATWAVATGITVVGYVALLLFTHGAASLRFVPWFLGIGWLAAYAPFMPLAIYARAIIAVTATLSFVQLIGFANSPDNTMFIVNMAIAAGVGVVVWGAIATSVWIYRGFTQDEKKRSEVPF